MQSLTFWNKRNCSLTILKQSTGKTPLTGAVFHVTDEDGAAIGTNNGRYTTDRNGLITITGLQPGQILIVTEEKAPNGYVLDMTPKTIKIKQGVANSLIFENARAGSLVINKYSALDRKTPLEGVTFKITTTSGEFLPDENGKISSNGLYYTDETGQIIINSIVGSLVVTEQDTISGVTFLLYDSANKPIGQYTTDNTGYIYIEDLTVSGRYFLKEMENKGYIVDTELKTVYVTAGETTLVEWKNTPITGQIQVTKTSAEYNTMNGWPAGTPLPNTEFEIYEHRSGNLADTIKTDKNGVAKSKPLPPGRYKVVESKSADFYGLDKTPIEVEIEYAGQIVKAAMTNKSLYTSVSITKRGYSEVVPGQSIKYDFTCYP